MDMALLPPWSNKWGPWLAQKVCTLPFCGWCSVLYYPAKKIALWWSWWWRPCWWSLSLRCWLFQTSQFHAPSLGNGSGSNFWSRQCQEEQLGDFGERVSLFQKSAFESIIANFYKWRIPYICWWNPVKVLFNLLLRKLAEWQVVQKKHLHLWSLDC